MVDVDTFAPLSLGSMSPEEQTQFLVSLALTRWENAYSQVQRNVLLALPMISGSMSVIGSSLILVMLYLRGDRRRLSDRIMVPMCLVDINVSLWNIFGALAVPKETGAPLARGTWTSCEASAFFTNFTYTGGIYNVFLLLYVLLKIRWQWQEEKLSRRLEGIFHATAFLVPLATGIAGIAINAISPTPAGFRRCTIFPYPPGCKDLPEVTCERGEDLDMAFNYLYIQTSILSVCFMTLLVLIYGTAMKVYTRSSSTSTSTAFNIQRSDSTESVFTSEPQQSRSSIDSSCSRSNGAMSPIGREARRERLQQSPQQSQAMITMKRQALWFGICFMNTYIWTIMIPLTTEIYNLQGKTEETPFWMFVCWEWFWPFQGFSNFIIFARIRFVRILRSRDPNDTTRSQTIWWVLKETIFGKDIRTYPSRRTRGIVNRNATGNRQAVLYRWWSALGQLRRPQLQDAQQAPAQEDGCNASSSKSVQTLRAGNTVRLGRPRNRPPQRIPHHFAALPISEAAYSLGEFVLSESSDDEDLEEAPEMRHAGALALLSDESGQSKNLDNDADIVDQRTPSHIRHGRDIAMIDGSDSEGHTCSVGTEDGVVVIIEEDPMDIKWSSEEAPTESGL